MQFAKAASLFSLMMTQSLVKQNSLDATVSVGEL
jgi:hypothetical protein